MSLYQKFKKFYFRSEENRMELFQIIGFIVLPIVGMAILFIIALLYLI